MPAWAHGTDGVGPALLSPDGAPVWWLLMDGYVYDIRDDPGGSYRRMVMVVPGHVTDGDGGAGIGHARSDFETKRCSIWTGQPASGVLAGRA
jgi:hypothetical protein